MFHWCSGSNRRTDRDTSTWSTGTTLNCVNRCNLEHSCFDSPGPWWSRSTTKNHCWRSWWNASYRSCSARWDRASSRSWPPGTWWSARAKWWWRLAHSSSTVIHNAIRIDSESVRVSTRFSSSSPLLARCSRTIELTMFYNNKKGLLSVLAWLMVLWWTRSTSWLSQQQHKKKVQLTQILSSTLDSTKNSLSNALGHCGLACLFVHVCSIETRTTTTTTEDSPRTLRIHKSNPWCCCHCLEIIGKSNVRQWLPKRRHRLSFFSGRFRHTSTQSSEQWSLPSSARTEQQ